MMLLLLIAIAGAELLEAHVVSMSSSELLIEGTRARFAMRMPLYEVAHVRAPQKTLFESIRLSSNRVEARLRDPVCVEDKQDASYRCRAVYEWPFPVEELEVACTLHSITVPNHVHLLRAVRGEKSDQAVFDFSNTRAHLRFRPPTAFEVWVTATGAGFARAFASGAAVLFLVCLVLASRSRRELLSITGMFLTGQIAAAAVVPMTAWNPAPRFVEAALALTVAYLAVEILTLPAAGQRWLVAGVLGAFHGLSLAVYLTMTESSPIPVLAGAALADVLAVGVLALALSRLSRLFPSIAHGALRVASALLLVTGLAWFFLRLRS
jgi:hypothetical protein